MIYLIIAFLLSMSTTAVDCLAAGGIVTDGSVGGINALHHPQALNGNKLIIPANLGTLKGGNLFHSFKEFNIHNQQAVTFQVNKPAITDNVITRVTGTSGSDIDGTLNVEGKANFYLINPNGVVFGKDAKINLPGEFHVSTAEQVKFKDGNAFNANLKNTSTLTSAAPVAFGFLGTSTANNGLIQVKAKELNQSFKEKQTLDFVAGNIKLAQAGGSMFVPDGGDIRIVAKTNKGLVSLERDQFGNLPLPKETPTRQNAGVVAIAGTPEQQFKLDVSETSGDKGGRIALWGGATTITDAILRADFEGIVRQQTRQVNLEIHANTLSVTNSALSADIVDSPIAGNALIKTTGDMSILDNSQISASTYGKGDAGTVTLEVDGNLRLYGARDTLTGVFTNSEKLVFETETGKVVKIIAEGDAGKININVGKHLDIASAAQISGDSKSGIGRGGDVTVSADGGITIDAVRLDRLLGNGDCPSCFGPLNFTGISSDVVGGGDADGGTVDVSSKGNIELRNAGWISSLNDGRGSAGNLKIRFGGLLSLENFALIRSDAHKFGDGGSITIEGDGSISVKDSIIKTTSVGSGGDIRIKANNLVLETGLIEANAESGHGGRIILDIQALISSGNTVNGQDIVSRDFLQKGRFLVWNADEFGNNIIRAFSQNGVDASIDLTATQLNLSGELSNLGSPQFDTGFLSQEYCSLGAGSSLRRLGRGGLSPKSRDSWVY